MRWRWLLYKAGFRPDPGSVFYSPTLELEYSVYCVLCGRTSLMVRDIRSVGGNVFACSDEQGCAEYRLLPDDTRRYSLPRWKLALRCVLTVIDTVIDAVRREVKMWTWHR